MLIKVGDMVRTDFCSGIVTEIIRGKDRQRWASDTYYRIKVKEPRLHWRKANQIIKIEEVKAHEDRGS